jgi:hypothetical protein
MSCPKCRRLLSETELVKILEESGVSEKTIKMVKKEFEKKQVAEALYI